MIRVITLIFLSVCSLAVMAAEESSAGQWPRTFVNADGTTTLIPGKPQKILSTTTTVTGTLLAIDAPVVASSTAGDGRFFAQWADIAKQRNVEQLWSVGSVDTEMVYAVMPDLIVVSATGGDSVMELVPELKLIAPVIIVDYGAQTWQELAVKLGFATGREAFVEQKISEFNHYLKSIKLNLQDKRTNIIAYNGAGVANAIAKITGPHSELLHSLGFEIEGGKDEWETFHDKRSDFVRVHYETLTLLQAPMTFLIVSDDKKTQRFIHDPVLVNLPSIQKNQVYALGLNSFRIDYYSSMEIVDLMKQQFGVVK